MTAPHGGANQSDGAGSSPVAEPAATASPATDFSVALLDQYLQLGLRDVVLSPGSRSQALALAAAEYERRGLLRLRVRIDERVGGFLALGLAVETGLPVLIITTSGSAVANLHPAVIEAHHSGVPLIVASADRPHELRGIRSSQTAEQPGIFGPAVLHSWDIPAPTGLAVDSDAAAGVARESWAAATSGRTGFPGPVHVNLAFREPLSGPIILPARYDEAAPDAAVSEAAVTVVAALAAEVTGAAVAPPTGEVLELLPEPGTVVVAGSRAGAQAEEVARQLGAPLLAEVASGARFGPNLVAAYRQLLAEKDFGGSIRRVIVFGHPTLSREVPALLLREGVETIVVRSRGVDDYNPGHRIDRFADAVRVVETPLTPEQRAAARAWVGRWAITSRNLLEQAPDVVPVELSNADFARRQLAIVREGVDRRMLVEAVWRATWPHDRLVFGASRLIREADAVVLGKKIRAHSNRGLAGIDGTIATALGIALASQGELLDSTHTLAGTTRVLVGDLTALHDIGALLFGTGEARPRIQVIVGNDGGGTIFDGLEVGSSAPATALDRVMYTAQQVDFAALATAYGWEYLRVSNRGELDEALTTPTGPTLIEIPLSR